MCIWISFHWLWTQQHDWVKRTPLCFLRSDWLTKMKESSSFPLHENNPVHKANSCELNGLVKSLRCRLRKGRGCAPNTTAKPRRALQIHRAAVRVRNLLFLERDPNWNGHVCFLRKRFVTADLNGLQAPVLLFCFNRERQTAKEM